MRAALRQPHVARAVPWLVAAIAAASFASISIPHDDGWLRQVPLVVVIASGLVVGYALILVAVARKDEHAGGAASAGLVALGVGVATAAASLLGFLFAPVTIALPVLAIAVAIAFGVRRGPRERRAPVGAVALGAAAGAVVLALGVLDGLVWLPQALAPGLALDAIYAELAQQGELGGIPWLPAWAALWGIATVAAGGTALRRRLPGSRAAGWTLAPAVVALTGLPWWQFAMGMGLSDAFHAGGLSVAMPWLAALCGVLAGVVAHLLLRRRDRELVAA